MHPDVVLTASCNRLASVAPSPKRHFVRRGQDGVKTALTKEQPEDAAKMHETQ